MSNTNALSAKARIETLVDENSFVEIGAKITKRSTDFNMQEKSVPADGVITGYLFRIILSISTVRMHPQ